MKFNFIFTYFFRIHEISNKNYKLFIIILTALTVPSAANNARAGNTKAII